MSALPPQSQTAITTIPCFICGRSFPRRGRAEACFNGHLQQRPYYCQNACGKDNCTASFRSNAGLRRHVRPEEERTKECPHCGAKILRQNYARHLKKCLKKNTFSSQG